MDNEEPKDDGERMELYTREIVRLLIRLKFANLWYYVRLFRRVRELLEAEIRWRFFYERKNGGEYGPKNGDASEILNGIARATRETEAKNPGLYQ